MGLEKRSGKVEKLKSGKVRWKCVSWKCVACAAVAIVLIAAPLRAQVPAQGVIAFTGARVIDGTGSAPIEQTTIVVTNGRITAIGPSASVMPPAGATIVNGMVYVTSGYTGFQNGRPGNVLLAFSVDRARTGKE